MGTFTITERNEGSMLEADDSLEQLHRLPRSSHASPHYFEVASGQRHLLMVFDFRRSPINRDGNIILTGRALSTGLLKPLHVTSTI